MDKQLIRTIFEQISQTPNYMKVLEFIDFDYQTCTGKIKYNASNIELDNSSKWYKEGIAEIHDEECVRAWLVFNLYFKYGYASAIGVVLLVICLLVTFFINKFIKVDNYEM